jgi:hypothetical protein
MDNIDLFTLRERFNRSQILLCFNGPISRSLIEEIGNALKNYLQADNAHPSSAMDVFGTYIEMTQNIRHYASQRGYNEQESSATVVVARDDAGHYLVQAGNLIEHEDADKLLQMINELAPLDKTELKARYKEQLRKPRDQNAISGAGLGLIDIARKSSAPLQADLADAGDGRKFFSLRAAI